MNKIQHHQFVVSESDAEKRLDKVLAANIPGLSRTRARVLLDIGGVFVDGGRVKTASRKLRVGQTVRANIGGAFARAKTGTGNKAREHDQKSLPQFRVIFEDDDIVVVDKPAGLLTAPTPESDRNNLADLLARVTTPKRPIFVVHRIDLQTSGLLVFARTTHANRILSEGFRRRTIHRLYRAVLSGVVPLEQKTVNLAVKGKNAVTHFLSRNADRRSGHYRDRQTRNRPDSSGAAARTGIGKRGPGGSPVRPSHGVGSPSDGIARSRIGF